MDGEQPSLSSAADDGSPGSDEEQEGDDFSEESGSEAGSDAQAPKAGGQRKKKKKVCAALWRQLDCRLPHHLPSQWPDQAIVRRRRRGSRRMVQRSRPPSPARLRPAARRATRGQPSCCLHVAQCMRRHRLIVCPLQVQLCRAAAAGQL